MALDTQDKRLSAIHLGSPWRGMLPLPDATLSQADRQHVMCLYRGILADAPSVAVTLLGIWSNVQRIVGNRERVEAVGNRERVEL